MLQKKIGTNLVSLVLLSVVLSACSHLKETAAKKPAPIHLNVKKFVPVPIIKNEPTLLFDELICFYFIRLFQSRIETSYSENSILKNKDR